jgi:hypothetical protein
MSGPSPFTAPCRPFRFTLVLLISALGGCGYHWENIAPGATSSDPDYKWPGLYRQDVKTVAVPVFGNRTYYRGVEFELTKAVINQIESRTPYKVVPREQADTILEGEVIDAGVHYQSRSQTMGLPQEQLYYLIVNFTWKDLRTGERLAMRPAFQQSAPYYPTLSEDRFQGSQEAVEQLAVAIVGELQASWGNANPATTQPKPQTLP